MDVQGTLVFAGDSVTDCGRREDPDGLGYGYVRELASHPRLASCRVVNAGVGGDRLVDLEKRWHRDVLEEQPDIVSILIGINDTWRHFDSGLPSEIGLFTERYRRMLTSLPSSTRIILQNPFVVPVTQYQTDWHRDLDPRITAIALLAGEFDALHVPLHRTLNDLAGGLGPGELTADGVHPTNRGHREIADAWLRTVAGP